MTLAATNANVTTTWGGLDGSYYVVQCYDTIVSGTNAAFGSDTAHAILVAPCPPIFGCMDSSYVEFNPRADTSDGSCSGYGGKAIGTDRKSVV